MAGFTLKHATLELVMNSLISHVLDVLVAVALTRPYSR